MLLKFTKMHGLGNDYVYLNCMDEAPEGLSCLAARLSDRHFGVGADGLICIFPSPVADFRMDIYNADGSRGEMCGNGIRCVGKYVYDKGLTGKTALTVETLAGLRELDLRVENGRVKDVTVDMGEPVLFCSRSIFVKGNRYTIKPVSMGNPHAVLYTDDLENLDLQTLGPGFERHPSFPNRTNTEFAQVLDKSTVRMRCVGAGQRRDLSLRYGRLRRAGRFGRSWAYRTGGFDPAERRDPVGALGG